MWKIVFPVLAGLFAVAVGLGNMPGGFSDVSPNDEETQNALNFAVVQHNRGTNDMYLRKVTDVIKAERQVVSGFKYRITVNMARTTCRRNRADEVCSAIKDPELAQHYTCTFIVWTQPWRKHIELMEQKC